ncbi:ribokinase [Agromyces sp. M3QZ16-3]|uniref:ribokinase n=1 Tax=Agromyces sp. M3QZ16-3 TaxID=3447585 RepID=UPI003F6947E7
MSRLVVLGSVNVDATSYVDAFPEPGETIHSLAYRVSLGGKGANQAIAAHLCGADVCLVARLGDDAAAEVARDSFARHGLPMEAISIADGTPTGVAQITVAATGENTIVVTAGANAAVGPEAVAAEARRIADAEVVLTQGELPVASVEALARACDEAGTRFVLNLAPPVPIADEATAVADPLVVNVHEARAVGIGRSLSDDARADAWRDAAASVVGGTARSVVVTLGPRGAVAASADGAWIVAAPEVDAVDTTGAGDAATGALAAMLAEGRSLPDALRVAVAAGTIAVRSRGTVDSYAGRADVLAFADGLELR